MGPIFAAMIGALGAAQIAQIKAQKFAYGGIIGGKLHSQGGTTFWGSDGSSFEAEKGELLAIVNRRSTGLLQYLSDLNVLGGGKDFFGSAVSSFASGGIAASGASQNALGIILERLNQLDVKVEIHAKTLTDLEIYKKTRVGQRNARIYGG